MPLSVKHYPHTKIIILPGDVLFTGVGRSTYFVGHAAIVGTDYKLKEALPGKPAGHELTVNQLWSRHNQGDRIILFRADEGGYEAADWARKNLHHVKNYTILNYDINNITENYCFKFIYQAYYFGAGISIIHRPKYRLITPFEFKYKNGLTKYLTFYKH